MHIALVVDPERLAVDGMAIERLAVALAAEGTQVTRVLPADGAEPALSRLFPVKQYDFDGSPLFRRSRLGALSLDMEEQRPDVFVAFGARALAAAGELAEDLESALISMVATEQELSQAPLRRYAHLLDAVGVSTGPLVNRALRFAPEDVVRLMPLGVALPSRPAPPAAQSVAIAGPARDLGAYDAVFTALADIAPALPDLQVAIELPPGHAPTLWRLAREHRVQSILNGVERLEQIRPLALQCAVMVLPEALHGTRSLVLEALATGRTVVCMDDSTANFLVHQATALVAEDRSPREWTTLLTRALLDPASTQPLRDEARHRMAAQYGSARCASLLLEACTLAVRGPVIPFQQSG